MRPFWFTVLSLLCLLLCLAPRVFAQHEGHNMAGMRMDSTSGATLHLMAQAIPLVTRAQPSAEGITRTEGALTQAMLMARATYGAHFSFDGTLNLEGLTMKKGELNTGALGEGYVDRRHPHTYLHEAVASALGATGPLRYSLSVGRGFAAFGTDDPMMRPLVKYPINHHLAQILERGVATVAMRAGAFMGEVTSFNGDEPTGPSSLPTASRLGDSWSARGTWLPFAGAEVQGSVARVKSPEELSGAGLDQRKVDVSARAVSGDNRRYVLLEWARTRDRDRARAQDVFSYQSALAEGSVELGGAKLALRLEQTERPEEDRTADPFHTPLPATDLSINGITRWRVVTMHVTAPPVTASVFSGFPFVEVAHLGASATQPLAVFTPARLYGTSQFWMFTAGLRLRLGAAHDRMGRYAVAVP